MGLQNHGSPNLGDFETATGESRDKKPFGCGPVWRGVEYNIRGKVVAFPKSGPW
jgi:hypothetical protein